jgi:Mce-associated membrane protein
MSTITTPAGRAVKALVRPNAPAPDTDSSTPRTARGARRALRVTPKVVWVVAALALVVSVGLGATKGREWYADRQVAQANSDALAAAKQLAINFVTVDYTKVDADTARVKAGATGEFLKSYGASIDELKKVLVANKSISTVQRSEVALVSGDVDSAVALVGVVAPTKNTAVPNGETKTYRMRLELQKVGQDWKVENLEFVG